MTSDKLKEAQRRLQGSDAGRELRARRRMSEALWFVSPDGEDPQGPHTGRAVSEMYARGALPPDFLIWSEGMPDWQIVEDAEGLRRIIEAAAPALAEPTGGAPGEGAATGRPATPSRSSERPAAKAGDPRAERTEVSLGDAQPAQGAGGGEDALAVTGRISTLVISHMNELHARLGDELAHMSDEQQRRYLAFELGALEFYNQTLLRAACGSEQEAVEGFYTLLVYHACEHYPKDSEGVIAFWRSLESERAMPEARKLGFHSVADARGEGGGPKRGHYPADDLRDALGLPRSGD